MKQYFLLVVFYLIVIKIFYTELRTFIKKKKRKKPLLRKIAVRTLCFVNFKGFINMCDVINKLITETEQASHSLSLYHRHPFFILMIIRL